MKHLGQITHEFLKEATEWDSMSRKQQVEYFKAHPKSKRRLTGKNEDDSDKLQQYKVDYRKHPQIAATTVFKGTLDEAQNFVVSHYPKAKKFIDFGGNFAGGNGAYYANARNGIEIAITLVALE